MGRLKEMAAVITKMVSKTESIIRISLEHHSQDRLRQSKQNEYLPESGLQFQIVVF